jgi:hypothetical protein
VVRYQYYTTCSLGAAQIDLSRFWALSSCCRDSRVPERAQHNHLVPIREIKYYGTFMKERSRGSSSSTVSDYGLDDRVIEVRSPTAAEDFSSSLCV